MGKHVITEDDVKQTIAKTEIPLAASHGYGNSKTLNWKPSARAYLVYDHEEVVLTTAFLDKALEQYNKMP